MKIRNKVEIKDWYVPWLKIQKYYPIINRHFPFFHLAILIEGKGKAITSGIGSTITILCNKEKSNVILKNTSLKDIEREYIPEYWCDYCRERFERMDLFSKSDDSMTSMICKKCAEKNKNKCLVIARFGDDFGDNACTFHCQLPKGHEGNHEEKGNMYDEWNFVLRWKKK